MKYSLQLLLGLKIIILSGFAQPIKDRHIQISASAPINGTEYYIKIKNNSKTTKIVFKIKDSLSFRLENDTNFIAQRNQLLSEEYLDLKKDTIITQIDRLTSLTEKYKMYSTDSIEIRNEENTKYNSLLDIVFSTPIDRLENQAQNRNRIILDGICMRFLLIDRDNQREAIASTPTINSHPLLYDLIINTLQIYRDNKKNSFLTKTKLFGY